MNGLFHKRVKRKITTRRTLGCSFVKAKSITWLLVFLYFLMISNPKYHISIIFQVKVEQNTLEIIEIVSQIQR